MLTMHCCVLGRTQAVGTERLQLAWAEEVLLFLLYCCLLGSRVLRAHVGHIAVQLNMNCICLDCGHEGVLLLHNVPQYGSDNCFQDAQTCCHGTTTQNEHLLVLLLLLLLLLLWAISFEVAFARTATDIAAECAS